MYTHTHMYTYRCVFLLTSRGSRPHDCLMLSILPLKPSVMACLMAAVPLPEELCQNVCMYVCMYMCMYAVPLPECVLKCACMTLYACLVLKVCCVKAQALCMKA